MINYRYRRLEKLGEGGSGQVFLVEDTLDQGRQLAMKILHAAAGSDPAADRQFRDEAAVLASLQHPNIIRVFDFGVIRREDDATLLGRWFFTMEYLHGLTALDWWRCHQSHPDRVEHLKQVVLQVLGVLGYVHRQGIIHFDIKPDNLLLISGGGDQDQIPLVKLMDFGLSAKQGAMLDFPLRGTLEYTAPELLSHETYDHRVDLYSLGVALFELIEDRCPFVAEDSVDLIKKVLTAEPAFHRCAEQEYSSMLRLLSMLLRKDPPRRCASAAEAARLLLEEDRGATALAFERVPKPTFVGRKEERERISSAVAALGGTGTEASQAAIVLAGPEGIGKTALLNQVMRVAQATDTPVLEVAVGERDLAFSAMLSLLPRLRAEGMTRSGECAETVQRFADVIDGGSGSADESPGELPLVWMRERDRVVEAQGRFVSQIAALIPLMLVVDDAHRLDAESEEVLRIAARDAEPGRLLILAAASDKDSVKLPGHHLGLEELDERCVIAMTDSMVSTGEVGALLGSRLYQLYGGNPALIVEALRSVSALLPLNLPCPSVDVRGLVESILSQLPQDVDELLMARYRALDRERQLVLDLLSCFTAPARLDILHGILPFRTERTNAHLSSLEAEDFVASSDGGQRLSLRHARLKAMVYAGLGEARRDSHLFIATTMEGVAGARSLADLDELAHQFEAAGRQGASIRWLEAAADEGMHLAAHHRAKALFQEAIRLSESAEPEHRDRLRGKLARCLFLCGDLRESAELAGEQLRNSTLERAQQGALHKTAGLALSRLGRHEESRRHLVAALASSGDVAERVELQQELVGIEIALGRFAEAERSSMAQLAQAKEIGDPHLIASIRTDLGIATFFQNLYDQSAGHFEEAMRIHAASGQRKQLADALMNVANVMSAKGEILRAIEYWNDALTTSQEYGTLHQQAQIQNNLGIAHSKLKRFPEARQFFDRAKAIFGRLESTQGRAFVLTNLGEVMFAECRYEQALETWQEAQRLYREMDDGQGMVETLLQLADVLRVLGSSELAGCSLEEAEALINERSLEAFRSQLLYLRGMQMMFVGNHDAALLFFARADQSAPEDPESERRLLLRVRMAECEDRMGRHEVAVKIASQASDRAVQMARPQVVAEASLLLGTIAASSAVRVPQKALPMFRKGFDAIVEEPVTEPDEMVPLWKILHIVGADWTYGSKGWGGENYCMFLAENESWEHITRTTAKQADELGCKIYLNTE